MGFLAFAKHIDYTTPAGRMTMANLGAANQFISEQTGLHTVGET